jgi:hypothetical protein
MLKRDFLELFRPAWHKAFSVANVQEGFAKTGIWLFLPLIVLSVITSRPETPPNTQTEPIKPVLTLITSKSIRKA